MSKKPTHRKLNKSKKTMKNRRSAPTEFAALAEGEGPLLSKGSRTKLQILYAAIELLHQESLDNFSFESVAKAAKLNKPLVAHHFPSKLILIQEMAKLVFRLGEEYVLKHLTTAVALDSKVDLLKIYCRFSQEWFFAYESHSSTLSLAFHFGSLTKRTNVGDLQKELLGKGRDRVLQFISKKTPSEVDKLIASRVYDTLVGRILLSFVSDLTSESKRKAYIEETWARISIINVRG